MTRPSLGSALALLALSHSAGWVARRFATT